jgi:hypothetical protein
MLEIFCIALGLILFLVTIWLVFGLDKFSKEK